MGRNAGLTPPGFCFTACPVAAMLLVCHTGASLPMSRPLCTLGTLTTAPVAACTMRQVLWAARAPMLAEGSQGPWRWAYTAAGWQGRPASCVVRKEGGSAGWRSALKLMCVTLASCAAVSLLLEAPLAGRAEALGWAASMCAAAAREVVSKPLPGAGSVPSVNLATLIALGRGEEGGVGRGRGRGRGRGHGRERRSKQAKDRQQQDWQARTG